MKRKFTIAVRLYLGFGTIILLTVFAFGQTFYTLYKSKNLNDKINDEINPSLTYVEELKIQLTLANLWINNWVSAVSPNDNKTKDDLKNLIFDKYKTQKLKMLNLSEGTEDNIGQDKLMDIFLSIDTLFALHKDIMQNLNNIEAYNDFFIKSDAKTQVEPTGEIGIRTAQIFKQLQAQIDYQRKIANSYNEKMVKSFDTLQQIVLMLGLMLVVGGLLIAVFTIRSIVSPITQLKRLLLLLGRGVIPQEKIKKRTDEIGEMSVALESLIAGFQRTTKFAREVGSGNFDSVYEPLSNEDSLGSALLKMRKDLEENERMLERKVQERTEEVVRQKEHIEEQRAQLEYVFSQVTDSIKYAKRIQEAILPPQFFVQQQLPQSFILFKPKDIVSGDFYFVERKNNKVFFAVVDCTGHGVPGAFMSIVGYNILKHALASQENPTPSTILDDLSKGVNETLHQSNVNSTSKDGMDVSICALNLDTKELEYAGAYNSLYVIRKGEIQEIGGDKLSIGLFVASEEKRFTNNSVQLMAGDSIYIRSDGYCDQFGGPHGKKFLASRFRNLLLSIQEKTMLEQRQILVGHIDEWRGNEEQIDDILVMGVRV